MNRVAALVQKRLNPIETPRCVGNLQRRVRKQPKRGDAHYVGKVQALESCIVRQIKEDVVLSDGGNLQPVTFGTRISLY